MVDGAFTWLTPVALVALVDCATREPLAPPDVAFSGCARVLAGPICALGSRRALSVWVREAPGAQVTLRVDHHETPAERSEVEGGGRYVVQVPDAASTLSIHVAQNGVRRAFHLALRPAPTFPRLEEAEAVRRGGDAGRAAAVLAATLPSMGLDERALATGLLGRIALSQDRIAEAETKLTEAMALQAQVGCLSCLTRDGAALAHTLLYRDRNLRRARDVLGEVERATAADPAASAQLPYYAGLVDLEGGDLRGAVRNFERARQAAARLGMAVEQRIARQMIAFATQALGQFDHAAQLFEQLRLEVGDAGDPCEQAALYNNAGWARLLEADAYGLRGSRDLASDLNNALALYERACAQPVEAANVNINLAFAALLHGDLPAARKRLADAAARLAHPEPRLRLWQLDIAARIALASARPAAAHRLYTALDELGMQTGSIDARWRAAQGRARTLWTLRQYAAALAVFAQAEQLLDEAARRVALGEGRDTFLSAHAHGTNAHVGALLDLDRTGAAADVARRGRSRLLASLARVDQLAALAPESRLRWDTAVTGYRRAREALEEQARDEWRLAGDALARARAGRSEQLARLRVTLDEALALLDTRAPAPEPPAEGEVLILVVPVERDWLAFAVSAQSTEVVRVGESGLAQPEQILDHFAEQIASAKRIRMLTAAAADAVDFHAVVWRGRPLIAHAPVVYALDGARSEAAVGDASRAVVIADPSGDLPAARAEAAEVEAELSARGFDVEVLLGGVRSETMVSAAARSTLLHYAGHGEASRGDAYHGGLRLSATTWFDVGDILTLPRAPQLVVLASCETVPPGHTPVVGLTPAQAFVQRGAGVVVAASRPVDDAATKKLMLSFYRHLGAADPWAVADALRAAQLEQAATDASAAWSAFRVLMR